MNSKQQQWDVDTRPDIMICPERFCFSWAEVGTSVDMSGQVYPSFEQAWDAHAQVGSITTKSMCTEGGCRRLTHTLTDSDFYEPCEPYLQSAGLPELYFSNPFSLIDEFRAEYEKMARTLWPNQTMLYNEEQQQEITEIIGKCIHEWGLSCPLIHKVHENKFDREIRCIVNQLEHMTSPIAIAHMVSEEFNRAFCTDHFVPATCIIVAFKIHIQLKNLGYIQ